MTSLTLAMCILAETQTKWRLGQDQPMSKDKIVAPCPKIKATYGTLQTKDSP